MKYLDKSILSLLKKGGFILYTRHGQATIGVDQTNLNFQDCYTQRNLSEVGRREAIYFGQMLRYYHIPIISPIVASPFVVQLKRHSSHFHMPISKLIQSGMKFLNWMETYLSLKNKYIIKSASDVRKKATTGYESSDRCPQLSRRGWVREYF